MKVEVQPVTVSITTLISALSSGDTYIAADGLLYMKLNTAPATPGNSVVVSLVSGNAGETIDGPVIVFPTKAVPA